MKNEVRLIVNLCLIITFLFSFIHFQPSHSITQAQNTHFTISGRVTDGFGHGLAGVKVAIEPKFRVYLPLVAGSSSPKKSGEIITRNQTLLSALTDENGYYSIADIPNGFYALFVDMPGVSFSPERLDISQDNTGSQDFALYVTPPVITPETVILSELSNQFLDLTIYDGETFTFTQMTTELEQVTVDDIIVSDASSYDPDGYFRKVSLITPQGSGIVINTIPATLDESILEGTAFLMESLQPSQIKSMVLADGVSSIEPQINSPQTFYFEIDNVVLFDLDEDYSTTYDQIKADGSVEFEMDYICYLDMQGGQVRRFSMTHVNSLRDNLEFHAETELLSLEEEVILAAMYFSPITFMIGPVPIVFIPKLDVVVGVDGSVTIGVSTELSHEITMRTGVQYQPSSGWSPISDSSESYTFTPPHLTLEMTLKGYLGERFNLYLYGLAGPFVKITPFLEIKVEPFEEPWWTLYGGIDVPVGFRSNDALEKLLKLDEYEVLAIGRKEVIAQANNADPGVMVSIPAGEFQMGCDPDHNGGYSCGSDELPLHTVYLNEFTIDTYEVTNAQYALCVAEGGCNLPRYDFSWTRPSYYYNPTYANYPVIYVDWNDAQNYCTWAGKQLPTEAQWEKSARSTLIRAYPWGDADPNCDLLNSFDDTAGGSFCVGDTSEVGSYPAGASPYGAFDMAGNVWEWVQDWYLEDYYSTGPSFNPQGPVSGVQKVVRGGSWYHYWYYDRSASRSYNLPEYEDNYIGFRCAFSLNRPPEPPDNPTPVDGAVGQSMYTSLSWFGSDPDGDWLLYDVYFEAENPDPSIIVADHQNSTSYDPGLLQLETTYYWKVVAFDEEGLSTSSPVWSFTTMQLQPPSGMAFIPGGEFQMGCDPAHNGGFSCNSNEIPLHAIYLDPFFIDLYEVTNADYAQCVSAGACSVPYNFSSALRPSYYDNPTYANYPVIFIDWFDAQDYCSWAGKQLPTEAQWEKAARGTTIKAFPWGDESPNCSLTNTKDNPTGQYCVGDTMPVGSYPDGISEYGLFDMSGNVIEWIADWFIEDYYSFSPYENPTGPGTGSFKLVRGGSWWTVWSYQRTAFRYVTAPDGNAYHIGFRCALNP